MHLNLLFFKIKYIHEDTQDYRKIENVYSNYHGPFLILLLFVKLFANLKWRGIGCRLQYTNYHGFHVFQC